ncbi:MAG: PGF-pre-PGF domain-containing protein [Candidatus Methanoperedens sp.]
MIKKFSEIIKCKFPGKISVTVNIILLTILLVLVSPINAKPDDKAPVIFIISPTEGHVFSIASITVSGIALDNNALSKVEVKVGSGSWLPVTGTTFWSVDSEPLTVGANIITARATDTSDNVQETSVTVTYAPSDVEPPVIFITFPAEGHLFSVASITVSGIASDNKALSKVEAKVENGSWVSASGNTSWTVSSMNLSVGSNMITAKATDNSNNKYETSVNVTYSLPDNIYKYPGSGENASNIELIEKYDLQISRDVTTSYRFTHVKNPIMFVNITGNRSQGIIMTSEEVLKGTSSLVKTPPGGLVYKNINIWVGTSGFATPRNIKEALIIFRVDNNWMSTNSVISSDIILKKWNGNSWIELETRVLSKDYTNTFFEGKTNAFSPFAITVKPDRIKSSAKSLDPGAVHDKTSQQPAETPIITRIASSSISNWSIILIILIINIIIVAMYFLWVNK